MTECNKSIDALSVKLAEAMESAGVDKFSIAGVGSLRIEEIHRPTVADRDALLAWLDARGMGALAPRGVHPKRLQSLVKELLEEKHEELPAGVTNFKQKRAVIRRS